ncbi:MAG: class I SAM-dependent methyltransferase [Melioribacteraceae bacterium]|nr:class I SAM-dependent methyltransferase [Melioribacteraceae bacterium]
MNEENRNRSKSFTSGERIIKKDEFLGLPSTRYRMAAKYINKDDRVYDIGCGSGFGSELLYELCGCAVVGIDDSIETIEFAQDNRVSDIGFFIVDIGKEDCFEPNIYNTKTVVVACEILEHFPNPEVVMQNIKLLNPRLIIGTVPEKSAQHVDKWHYREFEVKDLEELFNGIGYKLTHTEMVMFSRGNAIFFVAIKGNKNENL